MYSVLQKYTQTALCYTYQEIVDYMHIPFSLLVFLMTIVPFFVGTGYFTFVYRVDSKCIVGMRTRKSTRHSGTSTHSTSTIPTALIVLRQALHGRYYLPRQIELTTKENAILQDSGKRISSERNPYRHPFNHLCWVQQSAVK